MNCFNSFSTFTFAQHCSIYFKEYLAYLKFIVKLFNPLYSNKAEWLSTGFLTGTLQNHARKYNQPIDQLSFNFNVQPHYRNQEEIAEATSKLEFGQTLELDQEIESPEDGVLVHGLYMDASRWDDKRMVLADPFAGEMNPVFSFCA